MAPNGVLEALDQVAVPVSSAEEELDFHVRTDGSSPCADGSEALEVPRAIVGIKFEVDEDVG